MVGYTLCRCGCRFWWIYSIYLPISFRIAWVALYNLMLSLMDRTTTELFWYTVYIYLLGDVSLIESVSDIYGMNYYGTSHIKGNIYIYMSVYIYIYKVRHTYMIYQYRHPNIGVKNMDTFSIFHDVRVTYSMGLVRACWHQGTMTMPVAK